MYALSNLAGTLGFNSVLPTFLPRLSFSIVIKYWFAFYSP